MGTRWNFHRDSVALVPWQPLPWCMAGLVFQRPATEVYPMKREMRRPVRRHLPGWMAVIGLSLMSVQATAFSVGQLEATEPETAMAELVNKLSYATPGQCRLSPVADEHPGGSAFKLECPDRKFLVKQQLEWRAEAFARVDKLMKDKLPLAFSAVVVQPIAEFSFAAEDGERYYTVYPWVEARTLDDLSQTMVESGFDPERLHNIYSQIGSLLGTMHRAGLANAGTAGFPAYARMMYTELNGQTLKVTPDDRVVMLETNSFRLHPEPRPAFTGFYRRMPPPGVSVEANRQLLPAPVRIYLRKDLPGILLPHDEVLRDSPVSSAWWDLLPGITDTLVTSYCQTLAGEAGVAACSSQVTGILGDEIRHIFRMVRLFGHSDLAESALESRLEAVFPPQL